MSAVTEKVSGAYSRGLPCTVIAITRDDAEAVAYRLRESGLSCIRIPDDDDQRGQEGLKNTLEASSIRVVTEAGFRRLGWMHHDATTDTRMAIFGTGWAVSACSETKIEALVRWLRPATAPVFFLSFEDELLRGYDNVFIKLLSRGLPRRRRGLPIDSKMADQLRARQFRSTDRAAQKWLAMSGFRAMIGARLSEIERIRLRTLLSANIVEEMSEIFSADPGFQQRITDLLQVRQRQLGAPTAIELLRRTTLSSIDRNRKTLIYHFSHLQEQFERMPNSRFSAELGTQAESLYINVVEQIKFDCIDYMENVAL